MKIAETPARRLPAGPFSLKRLFPSGPVLGLLAVLALFTILLAWKGQLHTFLGLQNIQVLVHKSAIPGVIALGMLLIVISGNIDLSVGSVAALVTVVAMQVYRQLEAGTGSATTASLGAVAAGLATGATCGLVNGLVVTRLRVTPFVATLGMLSVARGLAFWLSGRRRISFPGSRPAWVDALARANVEYTLFDPGVWSLIALAGAVAVVLHFTVLGRHTYAIGSNEAAARLCGVQVERTRLLLFGLAGLLTGWGGVLLFAHGTSGDPNAGVALELDVIAAVVIGGASLNGGRGTVFGTLLGVLMLGILENGVSFFDVPVEAKHILIGVIIVANTALSEWQRRRGRE